jgi:flavin-dependent dehydrogenase
VTAADVVDALIVGGGPAGSTAGALLARAGHRVCLVDKEPFPRFHIGESLLPCDLPIFDQLGIEATQPTFLRKDGAEFHDERIGVGTVFSFADGLPGTPPHAYQVDRAAFDDVLLRNAERSGVDTRLGRRVVSVAPDNGTMTVALADGERLTARYVVDATGQDAMFSHRERSRRPIKDFGVAAVFCHFSGLKDRAWAELAETGNIRVLLIEDGWIWLIPLHERRLSVGVVTRRQGVTTALFDATYAGSPMLQGLTAGCTRTEPRVIRNFSYRNLAPYGPRWCCIGDAALFLDPVFSTGVSLGMMGAQRTAEALGGALTAGSEGDPNLMRPVSEHMIVAYRAFGSLVRAFYNTPLVHNVFFAATPDPAIRSGIISLLAGDVWRDDNVFQHKLLASRRRRFEPYEED